jgi:tetratricopeptide (TPR) repeat protein
MHDWRHRILDGLRHSRILLVCLSPDYFASEYCRWEFEEYIQRQVHRLMGFDSFAQVYFVEVPGVPEQQMAAGWYELLRRTNYTDLRPWFPSGVSALREATVRDKIAALGASLYDRIQRARRAMGVPGNLRRLNPHFVGHHTELRRLHENLAIGAVGVVTAVHGLGGQGKTELATAYAHGWADSYPAGLWVLNADGKQDLLSLLGELCSELQIPVSTGLDESSDARGRRVLAELRRRAAEAAPRDPDRGAATLVILDNVSEPALLSEPQLSRIPREDWLRVVATTREGPDKFPASRKQSLAFIPVDALSEDDAARLIEDHQIETDGKWPAASAVADAAAARALARELGGFTLAVESVAIYLGLHPEIRPADYLARLRQEGLTGADSLPADASVSAQMQHREKQLRIVLDQTLARLTAAERTALNYAALLPPYNIPWPWLRAAVTQQHPEDFVTRPGYADPWSELRRRLEGLRLLTPGDHLETCLLHRMVAAHMRERLAGSQEEMLRRLRDKVEDFALALQDDMEHAPERHVWQILPLQQAVRHWLDGEQDTALGHIAGIVGQIEATIGRLDVAGTFLELFREIAERLLTANPESAQAARDVMVSIVRLAKMRAQQGDAESALADQVRALNIARQLWERSPSYESGRTFAISLLLTAHYASAAEDNAKAAQHRLQCFTVLDLFVHQGVPLDAEMRQLHAQLKAMFEKTST